MNPLAVRRQLLIAGLVLILSWAGPNGVSAAGSDTIRNIPPTPHSAPEGTSSADLAAAIIKAGDTLGWEVTGESPGRVALRLLIRAHRASVLVGYDENAYWIDYAGSYNLDYRASDRRRAGRNSSVIKGPSIHSNYNRWVDKLSNSISENLMMPPKRVEPRPASSGQSILIADELEKLDALRDKGILTDEEFDRQKAKLLAR